MKPPFRRIWKSCERGACRCVPFAMLLGFAVIGVLLVSGKLKPRPENTFVPGGTDPTHEPAEVDPHAVHHACTSFWSSRGIR